MPNIIARLRASGDDDPWGAATEILTIPELRASAKRRETDDRDSCKWRAMDSIVSFCT
ncbi:MAG: hypothetical protein FWF28_10450 [Micrococcales bacterium]|nr:hypothetical protein [Micrococcales bacterium]